VFPQINTKKKVCFVANLGHGDEIILTNYSARKKEAMFRILSDLHLEFHQKYFARHIVPHGQHAIDRYFGQILSPEGRNQFIILAGDVGHPDDSIYECFLDWTSRHFQRCFMVTGNHEHYSFYRKCPTTIEQLSDKIRRIVEQYDNVVLLDRSNPPVVVDDWVIMGVTLWTYIPPENAREIQKNINDFTKIWYTNEDDTKEVITPAYQNQHLHQPDLDYLAYWIPQYKDYDIMVVTHHLPSFQMIPSQYKGSSLNYAFSNQLDDHLAHWSVPSRKQCWIAGHSHGCTETNIGNWHMYLNARGAPDERTGYDPQKTIQ
jgi:hypothetical protein